jgi:hypothetical protein
MRGNWETRKENHTEAAVTVAVYRGKYGRSTVLSRPLQAPEKVISTAE